MYFSVETLVCHKITCICHILAEVYIIHEIVYEFVFFDVLVSMSLLYSLLIYMQKHELKMCQGHQPMYQVLLIKNKCKLSFR